MAKATASNASPPIDADEILPEEIPAELLERVAENHAYMVSMQLQVRRGGTWKHLRNGTRTFNETPPVMNVVDICTLLVRAAKADAEVNGSESIRYRVRMRCKQGQQEYTRFGNVRGYMDEHGEMQIADDDAADQDATIKALQQTTQQSANIAFQCLTAVMQCTKGFAEIAGTFQSVLGAAGEVWRGQVSGQVELLRVKLEMEQAGYQHEEKMAKVNKGFAMLERPFNRIGDEIIELVVGNIKTARAKQQRERAAHRRGGAPQNGNGNGATHDSKPHRSPFAEQMDTVFDDLTEQQVKDVQGTMTEDEWKLLEVARRAVTDSMFVATFTRFKASLLKRGDDGVSQWVMQVHGIIGPDAMMQLGLLFKAIERPDAPVDGAAP